LLLFVFLLHAFDLLLKLLFLTGLESSLVDLGGAKAGVFEMRRANIEEVLFPRALLARGSPSWPIGMRTADLVVGRDEHAGAWAIADFARLSARLRYLAMGIQIGK